MGTTSIVYTGPSVGVEIADTGQWAAKGEAFDVETDLASSLLEQDCWARATTKAAKKAHTEGRRSRAAAEAAAPAPPLETTTSEED